MALIRSISGVRATYKDNLTPAMIARYAVAFASMCEEGTIVIGRDGRKGGAWIAQVIAGAIASTGKFVMDLGIVPTPTVQVFAERPGISGGISITASHNPAEWNGMKFIGDDGVFIDQERNEKLWKLVDSGEIISGADFDSVGEHFLIEGSIEQHADFVLTLPLLQDVLPTLQQRRLCVVVDAVNASGSAAIPLLLRELGCKVIELYCDKTGDFPHPPEPLPENLKHLAATVKAIDADLGVAVDPDADRLVLVDEKGNAVWEEYTITLAVQAVAELLKKAGESPKGASVVVNLSTTKAVDIVAARHEMQVYRSPVGEINVVNEMREREAIIGGEGSGGVIFPDCHYGRDALVGVGLILSLMAAKEQKLSEIIEELPQTSMIKRKYTFDGDIDALFDDLITRCKPDKIHTTDGLRIELGDYWLHLRRSNTEPIIRCIVEADSEHRAAEVLSVAEHYINLHNNA